MESLFYVGIIFFFGSLVQWLSPKFHMPTVVSYLILGLLIGPEIFGLIPREFVEGSYIVTDVALSVIAVLVGAKLKLSTLKGRGKEIVYITLFQSIGTFISVAVGFSLLGGFLNLAYAEILFISLLLAGIASATAPATPLAIVRELKAEGTFTTIFLAIVATDDAISLIMFSLALAIGMTFIENGPFEWITLLDIIRLIGLSMLIGVVAAFINTGMEMLFKHKKSMETISTLGLIFIVYSLSKHWHLEPLLSAMFMGIVMANTSSDFDIVEEEIDNHLAEIIFMLFFIISAMHLELSTVFAFPLAIVFYIGLRFFGKVMGSYLGALLSDSAKNVKKYMGLALLPQAGVAIGLALSIQKYEGLEVVAPLILNIIITTTLVHELIGPFLTKYALSKSGESR